MLPFKARQENDFTIKSVSMKTNIKFGIRKDVRETLL